MKQREENIVAFDINTNSIKALLGSLDGTATDENLFFEVQGITKKLTGISKKGVVYKKEALNKSVKTAYDALCSFTGYDVRKVCLLYAYPGIRFFAKTVGSNRIRELGEIHITEEWLDRKKRSLQQKIAKEFPQEECTYFEIISIVADGDEVVHDPYEYTVVRSLSITYNYILTPKIFIEHIQESVEKVAEVSVIRPTAVSNIFFLTETQKDRGAIVLDISASFTTITVCQDGIITGIHAAGFGTNDIVNEITLHKKVSIEEAESIMRGIGDDEAPLKKKEKQSVDKKIAARVKTEILSYIRRLDPKKNFPGGIILLGDGAQYPDIENIIKRVTGLYTKRATVSHHIQSQQHTSPNAWESAYGFLCVFAAQEMEGVTHPRQKEVSLWNRINGWIDGLSKMVR